MHIEVLRELRVGAEIEIRRVLEDLHAKTGICPVAVNLRTLELRLMEQDHGKKMIDNVKIELESL